MAEKSNEPSQRREIYYSGRVQGVGFRYTTRNIASRFDVSGFVRNLPDGRVLLVVEGDGETLQAFVAAIGAEMEHYIRGTDSSVRPPTHEFTRFEIRH